MRSVDLTTTLEADSPFETLLGGEPLLHDFNRGNGTCLLLSGPPGAGKTTLALYLLHRIYQSEHSPSALLLSLVETKEQLERVCEIYNFDFTGRDQAAKLVPGRFGSREYPDLTTIAEASDIDLRPGSLVLVDGVSILDADRDQRQLLLRIVDQIKKLQLVAVLVAEAYRPTEDDFLQYAVDGVINVRVDTARQARVLEIAKLRWHSHDVGSHVFRLRSATANRRGVQVFPSGSCLIHDRLRSRPGSSRDRGENERRLKSGVEGFDEMVGREDGEFCPGDRVLLIGPADSGKFRFATQFLDAAQPDEHTICVSFVRDFHHMRERLALLSPDDDRHCECLYIDPTRFVAEEVFGAIRALLDPHGDNVVRLVVDGVSSVRPHFETGRKFERFLVLFLRLLETYPNVTSVLTYYTPRVFASYAEVDILASERFSMVIGFNFQELHNQLVRGIVILRSEGRIKHSALKVPDIVDGRYFIDMKAGWSRVGLLGGEREQVHEETPFLKLFHENKSETAVLKPRLDNFARRYPDDHKFTMVAKNNPLPTHWSFLGYAGTGHSNTKLVELRKYVMDVLRDNGVFLEIPAWMMESLSDRFGEDSLWHDTTVAPGDPRSVVPFYADVGVLAYQESARRTLERRYPDHFSVPETWDQLVIMGESFEPSSVARHLFVIPNTFNDAKNFVSFFFELCWTHGWEFPPTDEPLDSGRAGEELLAWVDSDFFDQSIVLLRRLVAVGGGRAIPDPNIGGHYHESVFSRRWFSKTQPLPVGENEVAPRLDFGIAPLPGVHDSSGIKPGISNLDLYALGIIRAALAAETGWMLATELVDPDVDVARARLKRGLPVSERRFRTQLLQDSLALPAMPEPGEEQRATTATYPDTLRTILYPAGDRRFRRTCDIPRFFPVERLLATELPKIFEGRDPETVKQAIRSGLGGIRRTRRS